MESAILEIINGLLCTDTEKIRASTAALMKVYEVPESLPCLVHIVRTNQESQIRHYAAVLLNKRLGKRGQWLTVPEEHKAVIQREMLQALIAEKEKTVRNSVAQFVGKLVRLEADNAASWMPQLVHHIFKCCGSADPRESEQGSSTYCTLIGAAPSQFSDHMDTNCKVLERVLLTADARGEITTPTVANMLTGTGYLVPFIVGNPATEQRMIRMLPSITKALHAFACKGDADEFVLVFEIYDNMAQCAPHLLKNIKLVMDFCLTTVGNSQLDDGIRVQVMTFVGTIARIKKKIVLKQKLLAPILSTIFEIICTEGDPDYDVQYSEEESSTNIVAGATQTLDLLALHMPPEKVINPLLELLEPALQSPEPMRRRAALLSMGMISEGCSETICQKYLDVMLNIIQVGIADSAPEVRGSAFFALGHFSEYLQPEIARYAPVILPVLFDYLQQVVVELKRGHPEPKTMDRMFDCVDTFCANLGEDIVPHLPVLMERLFEILEPQNTVHIRELALSTITSLSEAARENLVPYFPKIFEILKVFLLKEVPEEVASMRLHAMDTLASITRVLGREHVLPLANDTKNYCLMMLDEGPDDPDFRRGIYGLLGSLSVVVNESMAEIFPQIVPRLVQTVVSTEEIDLSLPDQPDRELILEAAAAEGEIDLDTDEEDDDDEEEYQVENDFIVEKEVAIITLKDFAVHTGAAFVPYLQLAFENVYKVLDHASESIRTSASNTLCEFVAAIKRSGDTAGVSRACEILLPKFAAMMRHDENEEVLIQLLDACTQLFRENKHPAMPNQECAELIFDCLKDTLSNQMSCQVTWPSGDGDGGGDDEDEDDEEEGEFADMILDSACNLVSAFGSVLECETFAVYFGRLYPLLAKILTKAMKTNQPELRGYVYGTLGDCLHSLGSCCVPYFDAICPMFLAGAQDADAKSRQNSYFGLGELVLHSEARSYGSYPVILQALSDAIFREKVPAAIDNICGAVSRLILTKMVAVPLATVLPVLLNHLPLREDFSEYDIILRTFLLLYARGGPSIVEYLQQMVYIVLTALQQKQILLDDQIGTSALQFLNAVREQHPDKFNNVANSNPEIYEFVKTL